MEKTGETHQAALRHVRRQNGSGGPPPLEQRIAALLPIAAGLEHGQRVAGTEAALEKILTTFTAADIYRTETVMCAGRDLGDQAKVGRYFELHELLDRDSPEITVSMMTEKMPLARYLRRGLDLAQGLGIQLEESLSAIAPPVRQPAEAPQRTPAVSRPQVSVADEFRKRADAFRQEANAKWRKCLHRLSAGAPNLSLTWTDPTEIIEVLQTVGESTANHLYFPGIGGLDVTGAGPSAEPGCVEVYCGPERSHPEIVRPRSLTLNFVPGMPSLSYLRIETEALEPTGVYESVDLREELVEVAPGEYRERSVWEDDDREPEWRLVTRHVRGAFVIFSKGSAYNLGDRYSPRLIAGDTYDARHDKMNAAEFRSYIESVASAAQARGLPAE
jgi:hypothetical protein